MHESVKMIQKEPSLLYHFCLAVAIFLCAAILAGSTLSVLAAEDDPLLQGWQQDGGLWWYRRPDGSYPANQWEQADGAWYHFDADGWMQTGWLRDGAWYYLDPFSGAMRTGWVQDGSAWYYMDGSGAMQTGWIRSGSHWYFMDETGAMQTGWVRDGAVWYYMDTSGAMATGWVFDNGVWYFLENSGAMRTGWVRDAGSWYYMDGSGAMQTGWVHDGTATFYLKSSGKMAEDETLTIDGVVYRFDKNGQATVVPEQKTADAGGKALANPDHVTGEDIISRAETYIGAPYRAGGRTKEGFDCSGFTYRVLNDLGIAMPKGGSGTQMKYGTGLQDAVSAYHASGDLSGFQPGDLLFYDYDEDNIPDHVAFYGGNANCIHAVSAKGVSYTSFRARWDQGRTLDSFLIAATRVL